MTTSSATTESGIQFTYEVAEYVDPMPGRKGSERVRETCWKCDGRGTVSWGNVTFVAQGVEDRHCFNCLGKGWTSVLVSTVRTRARREAKATTHAAYMDAYALATRPEREAAEAKAREAAEAREASRLAAKPKGHIGTVGERLRNLNAQVTGVYTYEAENFVTHAPELRTVVRFDILGKTAVWFTSWTTLEAGQFVSLTGTVKSHGERDGEDQTILTRCITK
jgi:hypothetical protein